MKTILTVQAAILFVASEHSSYLIAITLFAFLMFWAGYFYSETKHAPKSADNRHTSES